MFADKKEFIVTIILQILMLWNPQNIEITIVNDINTIYIGFAAICGSGKKYKNCCDKQLYL